MLLGLTGKAGSGKDTVAEYLVAEYGFKRYAFADAVRDIAYAINPIIMTNWQSSMTDERPKLRELRLRDYVDMNGWDWSKRNIPEIRRLLQVVGTEAGRDLLGENVWVDIVERKWLEDGQPDAVITDMRFPNEVDFIYSQHGHTVWVHRPENPDAIVTRHASEAYDFSCDWTLVNDSTIPVLHNRVELLIDELRR